MVGVVLIEWVCDCCGAYQTEGYGHKKINDEDHCEDCWEHGEHCHENVLAPECDRHENCCKWNTAGQPMKYISTGEGYSINIALVEKETND